MDDRDSFVLAFRLADSENASPSEFRSLFAAVDELTHSLVIEQIHSFVEMADISDRAREAIFASVFRLGRYVPAPVQVISIRRESPWTVLVGLPVAAVLWAMRKMIAPEVLQAWNESQLRENFKRFVRDGVFRGAKEQLETSAAAKPQFGNLIVDDISETGIARPEKAAIQITLRRTEVLQVEIKDRDLMQEFLAKIGVKQD